MRFVSAAYSLPALALTLALACPSVVAQTSDFLNAPVLPRGNNLALQLAPSGDSLEWQMKPGDTPVPIHKDGLVLSRGSFKLGYLHYNPLAIKLSASVKDFDDPAQASLNKLISALTSVAGTVSGAAKAAGNDAANLAAKAGQQKLDLTTTQELTKELQTILATPGSVGKQGIQEQQALQNLQNQLKQHEARLQKLEAAYNDLTTRQHRADQLQTVLKNAEEQLTVLQLDAAGWSHRIDGAWGNPQTSGPQAMQEGEAAIQHFEEKLEDVRKTLDDQFKISGDAIFLTGTENRSLNRLDTVIAEVEATKGAAEKLRQDLRLDEQPARWAPPNQSVFLFGTVVEPTLATGKEISVTVTPLTLTAKEDGPALQDQKTVTVTFKARQYRALLPEAGVGAVFGFINRPKYGTGKDSSGNTVVALSSTDHVSVDPAIMLNFVCRCNTGGLAPMLQLGAATSKDLPAVLLGGGLRLFSAGKGNFALGGGLLLGWYKDLQKLKVGSIVSGTADIDTDLGYIGTPKPAPYLNLQYKF